MLLKYGNGCYLSDTNQLKRAAECGSYSYRTPGILFTYITIFRNQLRNASWKKEHKKKDIFMYKII